MDKKIQNLYTQLTQKDREKVDAKIRELFARQQKLLADGNGSNAQRQKDYC